MKSSITQNTFGEGFIILLEQAETKGQLFAILEETVKGSYPQYDLVQYLKKISDFNSVATYQDKLARIRINYNARAAREVQDRLIGLKNFGEDNYKFKEKMLRKLNLLINNNPTLDDLIYITMSLYISKNYGSAEKFKKELKQHIKETAA